MSYHMCNGKIVKNCDNSTYDICDIIAFDKVDIVKGLSITGWNISGWAVHASYSRAFRILYHILEKYEVKQHAITTIANNFYGLKTLKKDERYFQQCCNMLITKYNIANKYISDISKAYERELIIAVKKIQDWWIPICYDLNHRSGCGKRMFERNWNGYLNYCSAHTN